MNTNEPMAWLSPGGDVSRSRDLFEEMGFRDLIPLYTHPNQHDLGIAEAIGFDKGYRAAATTPTVEEFDRIFAAGKRLGVLETEDRFRTAMNPTDREIEQIFENETGFVLNESPMALMDFARALLRKAQE